MYPRENRRNSQRDKICTREIKKQIRAHRISSIIYRGVKFNHTFFIVEEYDSKLVTVVSTN